MCAVSDAARPGHAGFFSTFFKRLGAPKRLGARPSQVTGSSPSVGSNRDEEGSELARPSLKVESFPSVSSIRVEQSASSADPVGSIVVVEGSSEAVSSPSMKSNQVKEALESVRSFPVVESSPSVRPTTAVEPSSEVSPVRSVIPTQAPRPFPAVVPSPPIVDGLEEPIFTIEDEFTGIEIPGILHKPTCKNFPA